MTARIAGKASPFFVLCCTMGGLIAAALSGYSVGTPLIMLNAAGLVLAVFQCLDPSI
jgi:hypothetical protein